MANVHEIVADIDIEALEEQIQEKLKAQQIPNDTVPVTIFSLGKDSRVSTKLNPSSPEFEFVQILKDGLDNPYIELFWRTPRREVDAGDVIGFNVWRRKFSRDEYLKQTRQEGKEDFLFSRLAFDKLSRKNIKKGKFSQEKKAFFQVKKENIPSDIQNSKLDSYEAAATSQYGSSLDASFSDFGRQNRFGSKFEGRSPVTKANQFENFINARKFEKIAFISYEQFLQKEKQKFVEVTEREFVNLSFKDKSAVYCEVYEYRVDAVTKTVGLNPQSDTIKVELIDETPVQGPSRFLLKQISETSIKLSVSVDPNDFIHKVIFYKKSEDETQFSKIAEVLNTRDVVEIIDTNIKYGITYTYRVFLENIYGLVSDPQELISGTKGYTGEKTTSSTVQKVTPQTRSNNLKIPVMECVPDQNSGGVKITVFPNDPRVSFYVLERKNITTKERVFSVPSRESNYGATGWQSNKFFVQKDRSNTTNSDNIYNQSVVTTEINFIDDTVAPDNIYQYRVRGHDLFGNGTSYMLKLVKAVGKKVVRTPINIKYDVLRDNPYRLKLSWTPDFASLNTSFNTLFERPTPESPKAVDLIYLIERRKQNEVKYQTFPWMANNFLIDEIATSDAVPFEVRSGDDLFAGSENVDVNLSSQVSATSPIRPFDIPPFLELYQVYYYRITARDVNGQVSNATPEFRVVVLPALSLPLDFKVEILNSKVRPLIARLQWTSDQTLFRPDRWIIERKFDVDNDTFEPIGRAYLTPEFFDKDLQMGNTYIYRIKSLDVTGRESVFVEARLTI